MADEAPVVHTSTRVGRNEEGVSLLPCGEMRRRKKTLVTGDPERVTCEGCLAAAGESETEEPENE